MALTPQPKRTIRPKPVSFRLSTEAYNQLTDLSKKLNRTKSEIVELLISREHADQKSPKKPK